MASAISEARTYNHVSVRLAQCLQKDMDLRRIMLSVSIDLDNRVVATSQRPAKSAAQCSTNAKVHWQTENIGSRVPGSTSSVIGRAVVDNTDIVTKTTTSLDDTAYA
jgi:hypothetical protein